MRLYGFSDILSSDFGYVKQFCTVYRLLQLTGNPAETDNVEINPSDSVTDQNMLRFSDNFQRTFTNYFTTCTSSSNPLGDSRAVDDSQ